jgi:hypothetical protein
MPAQLFRYLLQHRRVWATPLLISAALFMALFLAVGGNIIVPFLYK